MLPHIFKCSFHRPDEYDLVRITPSALCGDWLMTLTILHVAVYMFTCYVLLFVAINIYGVI